MKLLEIKIAYPDHYKNHSYCIFHKVKVFKLPFKFKRKIMQLIIKTDPFGQNIDDVFREEMFFHP